ncbi:homeobox protein 4-like isoform X2 [Bradysia coprophila]|uniref:homeobox protein 4-like isoform X2 n=1 Tax=Bradysia coprophila TaxID=38358 RepID=UPI00187D9F82|nr:homeobox protein 4-like isoform X2 [Bradysia coprophila]
MPDRPISEQDLIRMSTAPQLGQDATATPVQTTNDLTRRPEHRDSQIQLSHVNGIRPTQHRANATNSSTSANKSSSSTITKNETVDRISVQPSDTPHNFVPNFQFFNGGSNSSDNSQSNTGELPNLSILNVANGTNGQRECVSRNVPHISQITNQSQSTSISVISTDEEENSTGNVPHLSQLMNQSQSLDNWGEEQNSTDHHESPNANIPHFSQLLSQSHPTSDNLTSEQNSNDTQECFDGNVPHLSQLLSQSHPTTDEGESFEANVPHLSQLVNQSTDGSGA